MTTTSASHKKDKRFFFMNDPDHPGLITEVDTGEGIKGVYNRSVLKTKQYLNKHPVLKEGLILTGCAIGGAVIGYSLGLLFTMLWLISPLLYYIVCLGMIVVAMMLLFNL